MRGSQLAEAMAGLQRVGAFVRRGRTHAVTCSAAIDLLGPGVGRTAGLKSAAVIRTGLNRRWGIPSPDDRFR